MKALREEDGIVKYRRAASYHLGACKRSGIPLLATLRAEMGPLMTSMIAKSRQVEDAEDSFVNIVADADFSEIALEDTVREIHEDLGRADRRDPTLGSQKKVFPSGFSPVIDEENEEQFEPLKALRVKLAPFLSIPAIATGVATLDTQEAELKAKLEEKKTASALVTTLRMEEKACMLAVREQLQSAYGRLRDLFKSNPKMAERFFIAAKKKKTKNQ